MEDTDLLLVERAGTSYKIETQDMSNLKDSDLLLVERAGVSYKMTADQLPGSNPTGTIEQPVQVLTPFNGAGLNDGEDYQPLSTAITAFGAGGEMVYSTDTIANVAPTPDLTYYCTATVQPNESAYGYDNLDNLFDGDENTYAAWKSETSFTLTFRNMPLCQSEFSVLGYCASSNDKRPTLFCYFDNGDALEVSVGTSYFYLDLSSPARLTSIVGTATSGLDLSYGMSVLKFDGESFTVDAGNILTFPTDNNFDKFEVGEVVQTTSFEETFGASAGDPFYWGKNGTVFDRYVDIPVIPGTSYFKGVTSPGGEDGRTEIYDGNNVMYNAFNDGNGYLGTATVVSQDAATKFIIPAGFTGNVTRLYMVNSAGSVSRGTVVFSYDGVNEYTSTDGVINTSITAKDAAAKTMTTDGGSWYGADGTGDAGDGRYMPSQEWSSQVTVIGGAYYNPINNVFDGDLNTFVTATADTAPTLTFPETISATKVEIYVAVSVSANGLTVNGQDASAGYPGNTSQGKIWYDVTSLCQADGGLTSVGSNYVPSVSSQNIYAIRIDDKQLVDSSIPGGPGATDISKTITSDATLTFNSDLELANMVGPLSQVDENGDVKTPVTSTIANVGVAPAWNQSQIWRTFVTSTTGFNTPPENGFNGDISSGSVGVEPTGSVGLLTVSLSGLTPNADVVVYTMEYNGGAGNAETDACYTEVNGIRYIAPVAGPSMERTGTVDVNGNLTVYLNSPGGNASPGWNYSILKGISIKGKLLVDPGITGDPGVDPLLTFNAPNPDLQYFQPGDVAQQVPGYVTPTADRVADSNAASASQEYMDYCNIAGAFGLDYNTTEGTYYSSWSGGFNDVYFILNDQEYVNENFYVRNSSRTSASGSRVLQYAKVRFVMPDGSTQELVADTLGSGPAGESGSWRILRSIDFPSNFVDRVTLAVDRDQNATSYYPGISFGTRGVTTEPYQLKQYYVVDTDTTANTMTVDGGDWFAPDIWNQSQEWSSNYTGDFYSGYGAVNAFNGILWNESNEYYTSVSFPGTEGYTTVFDPPITGNRIEVIYTRGGTESVGLINGTQELPMTNTNPQDGINAWARFEINGTTLSSITMTHDSAGSTYFNGVYVDGKLLVDASVTPPGETFVTGPPLIASADDVEYLDGNTLGVDGVSGTWIPGLHAQGAVVTANAPSPESIIFTSMNAGTTEFTGTDASLTSRTWTLEKANSAQGPWTEVGVYLDFAANDSQNGATPWDNPILEPNTFYQVKVQYDSNNAASVVSTFNTFKTGDA